MTCMQKSQKRDLDPGRQLSKNQHRVGGRVHVAEDTCPGGGAHFFFPGASTYLRSFYMNPFRTAVPIWG